MDGKEFVQGEDFALVDLGNAKDETRLGIWIGPTDGIRAFYV
jgi:hypothetical protein